MVIFIERVLTERLQVDVLRVLLLGHLVHAESLAVGVDVVEHVGVLVASQPLVLPIETQRAKLAKQIAQTLL